MGSIFRFFKHKKQESYVVNRIPLLPNLQDMKVLTEYAVTFQLLQDKGLDMLLDMLESQAALQIRTFRDVTSHPAMCKLQGEIAAYMGVREAVNTVIRAYKQRLEGQDV